MKKKCKEIEDTEKTVQIEKFSLMVQKQELQKALAACAAVIPKRMAHLPVLACVQLEAEENSLTISATDLLQRVRVDIPANIVEARTMLLPFWNLRRLITRFRMDEIFITQEESAVIVRCGTLEARFPVCDPLDFPKNALPEEKNSECTFDGSVLEKLNRAAKIASKDDSRDVLQHVYLEPVESGTGMVATDGKRLFASAPDPSIRLDHPVTLHKELVDTLRKVFRKPGKICMRHYPAAGWITLYSEVQRIFFQFKYKDFTKSYPNWKVIVPETFSNFLTFSAFALRWMTDSVSGTETNIIQLEKKGARLIFSSQDSEIRLKNCCLLSEAADKEDFSMNFNPGFLRDACLAGENFRFCWNGNTSPVMFEGEDGRYILMPMR